jgi:hypothetical protein
VSDRRTLKLLALLTVAGTALALVGPASASPAASGSKPKPGPTRDLQGKTYATGVACAHGKAPSHETCYVTGSANATPANTLSSVVNGKPKSTTGETPGGPAIDCPTATVCVVGGASTSSGTVEWFKSGKPTATVNVNGSSNITSVACASATKCVAVGYHQNTGAAAHQQGMFATVTNSGSANGKRVAGTSELTGVACPTASLCIAAAYSGDGAVRNGEIVLIKHGHAGAAKRLHGMDQSANVSCGSSKVCWMSGFIESAKLGTRTVFIAVKGGKAKHPIVAATASTGLSCVSATTCYGSAIGTQTGPGKLIRIVNGRVKATVVIKKTVAVSGVSCPVPTSCLVTGPSSFHNSGQPDYFWRSAVITVKV